MLSRSNYDFIFSLSIVVSGITLVFIVIVKPSVTISLEKLFVYKYLKKPLFISFPLSLSLSLSLSLLTYISENYVLDMIKLAYCFMSKST